MSNYKYYIIDNGEYYSYITAKNEFKAKRQFRKNWNMKEKIGKLTVKLNKEMLKDLF